MTVQPGWEVLKSDRSGRQSGSCLDCVIVPSGVLIFSPFFFRSIDLVSRLSLYIYFNSFIEETGLSFNMVRISVAVLACKQIEHRGGRMESADSCISCRRRHGSDHTQQRGSS